MTRLYYILLPLLALLGGCRPAATVPADSTPVAEAANLYPDYRDIVIPPNICPLNVQVKNTGQAYVLHLGGRRGEALVTAADEDGKLFIDSLAWHTLLKANAGSDLTATLYTQREGKWLRHPAYRLTVAREPIDRYLSYRLIEPSYELYRQLGLYQRDLEGYTQHVIYENNAAYDSLNNHCVNCHNYQNYDAQRALFHVRARHGGTVFIDGARVRKLNMKCDSILSSTVYPAWHPSKPWVAFSSNQTGQVFHVQDAEKIEVVDYGSDLVFFDLEKQTLTNILRTDADLETFPCWSPDGGRLYYCSAHVPELAGRTREERMDIIPSIAKRVRYNLMSIGFDPATRRFSAPRVEMDCAAVGKSAAVPRVSPDGRYLLFTLADQGQFHIWHKSSDLYVKDLRTDSIRPLAVTNSAEVDSYHTWSSNGRWIVFSSRRDDGSYTRPYIAYFDRSGQSHRAFLLPQSDPELNLLLMKSYNVPELTRTRLQATPEEIRAAVMADEKAQGVTYAP